ncbi:hypothetical protein QNI16_07265 [Cytophagaceae bacterium YF14B1]|uniref:Uncharacterized protein n=1 Tax=Xanthocytophaga flava TaxID=3048013 RepID=A0AAE3QPE2_9BACT|nr:hypothetical protein [Xanthocytophaga flavus]MDJ1480278.1 hypothetical protein [Xanthocytophaga flavus]
MPPKKKTRPANRRIGFTPKGTNLEEDDIQGFPLTEKVKNPFKALGLRPAHIDFNPNNPSDRIYAWYMSGNSQELSPEDEWYHHVFKTAHSAQIQGYMDSEIAKILKKRFELSERLAYKYIYSATSLFGNANVSDKQAQRYMLTQMAKSCYRQARKDQDLKSALLAIREMKTINGLDREDAFTVDPAALGGNTFMVQINMVSETGEQKAVTIDLNTMDAAQEKLLQDTVNNMNQASSEEFWEILDRATDGDPE